MAQNRLFNSFIVKKVAKCVNLLIMRFDGSMSENLWGTFARKWSTPLQFLVRFS